MASKVAVSDVMTKDPIVATLPGNRTEVLRLLVQENVTGVPVIRADETYAGFVARKHIFAHAEEEQLALLVQKDYPTIGPDATVDELARTLVEGASYHVTVTENDRVVGIVTPADLLEVVEDLDLETPVDQLLHTVCVAVHEGTPLPAANEIMKIAGVFALPVLDDEGLLVGIITDRDIFGQSRVDPGAAMQELGLADEENPWAWEGLRNVMKLYYDVRKVELPQTPVRELMVTEVATVSSKTAVSEAARLMARHDYGQLPVMDASNRLEGLLTELDVISVLL